MKNLTLAILAFLFVLMGCKEEVTEKPIEQEKKEVILDNYQFRQDHLNNYPNLEKFVAKDTNNIQIQFSSSLNNRNTVKNEQIGFTPIIDETKITVRNHLNKNIKIFDFSIKNQPNYRGVFSYVIIENEGTLKSYYQETTTSLEVDLDGKPTFINIDYYSPTGEYVGSKYFSDTSLTDYYKTNKENSSNRGFLGNDCLPNSPLGNGGGGGSFPNIGAGDNSDFISNTGNSTQNCITKNVYIKKTVDSSNPMCAAPICIIMEVKSYRVCTNVTSYRTFSRLGDCPKLPNIVTGEDDIPPIIPYDTTERIKNEFQSKYNLTTDETQWYFTSSNSDFRAGIQSFEADYANAKVAVRAVIQLGHKNLLKGPYTDAQLQQIEEILPPITCAGCGKTQQTIEEYAYLIAKWEKDHPNQTLSKPKKIYLFGVAVWNVNRGAVHTALDICGLVLDICDPINGVIYTIEGDFVNARFSFAATIPVAGWASTGAKYAKLIVKAANGKKYKLGYKIVNGVIEFSGGSNFRKILGITDSTLEAHHLIPKNKSTHELVQRAAQAKNDPWHLHMFDNGVPAKKYRIDTQPDGIHANHPNYDRQVGDILTDLENKLLTKYSNNIPADEASKSLQKFQAWLKQTIENNSTTKINDLDLSGVKIDKFL